MIELLGGAGQRPRVLDTLRVGVERRLQRTDRFLIVPLVQQCGALEPLRSGIRGIQLERPLGELERAHGIAHLERHFADPARDLHRFRLEEHGAVVLVERRRKLAALLEHSSEGVTLERLLASVPWIKSGMGGRGGGLRKEEQDQGKMHRQSKAITRTDPARSRARA